MKADLLRDILGLLDGCDAQDAAKAEFRKLIHKVAIDNGLPVAAPGDERAARVEFARHLMKELMEGRPTTRERLIARFDVSRAQAYVDIADALKLSSQSARPLDGLPK
jgi:hypothetical protein